MSADKSKSESTRLSFIEKARREQIIEATIDTIAAIGYVHASLEKIARHAGISKGIISYHFAGKEDLIQQVVNHVYGRAGSVIAPNVHAVSNASVKLKAYIQSNLLFLKDHQKYIFTLQQIWANRAINTTAASEIETRHESGISDLEHLLSYGQSTGEFRAFEPRILALIMRNAIDMATSLAASQSDFDWDAYAVELVELFCKATSL
jgi:AcrR family transcriptional regulator